MLGGYGTKEARERDREREREREREIGDIAPDQFWLQTYPTGFSQKSTCEPYGKLNELNESNELTHFNELKAFNESNDLKEKGNEA